MHHLRIMSGKIVRDYQLCTSEMLAIKINYSLLCFQSPFFSMHRGGQHRMSLSPHAKMTDIYECHIRIPIITACHTFKERIKFRQKHRVVILWFLISIDLIEPGTSSINPLRRSTLHPVFCGCNTKSHTLPCLNPALCRCIKDLPTVSILLWLDESPRESQIHRAQSRKILKHITGFKPRTIILKQIGIEVHGPPHSRIDKSHSVINQTCLCASCFYK